MEIRDYKTGDDAAILGLFKASFKKELLYEYWKWRFPDNLERKIMIKLMWEGDQLVGHYAVSPVKMNVDGEVVLTALSMTTMTHPDFGGRGIFTDLAEALYNDEGEKSNLKAVWGFPNSNSHYGFIKNLKWLNLEQVPTFSVLTDKIKKAGTSNIGIVSGFNSGHVKTQQKLLSNYHVKAERSAEYLTWRYLKNPINKYAVFELKQGEELYYAVTKLFPSFTAKDQFEIDILELMFPADHNVLLDLMNAIKEHYGNHRLLQINTWVPLNDEKHLPLEKIGFINTLPITYSGIRILDKKYNRLAESNRWFYSMGDSDIY
jgi:hypothetical protein